MDDKIKSNSISIRLNDENLEKLEILSASYDSQKSTMAANIVSNVLNENMHEFEINHIHYPRPVIKKLFSLQDDNQLILIIALNNQYNKGVIQAAKRHSPNYKILNTLKKSWKRVGCEIRDVNIESKKILEVHHEMEKNWSTFTCATTSYILEILGYKIYFTMVEEDWFKIEYLES